MNYDAGIMYSVSPLVKPPRVAKRKKDSGVELEAELATVAVQANTKSKRTTSTMATNGASESYIVSAGVVTENSLLTLLGHAHENG